MKSVDADTLRVALRTQAGDVFDADAVDKTVDELAIELARRGAPFAGVIAHSEPVPGQRLLNLAYMIVEGKRLYVERIDIHGNTRTHDEVIRREFDLGEGDAYSRALVDRAERRLKALGYFKTVKIVMQPGSAPDRVVLDVAVEEDKTGSFFISGGYSTTDGMMASVSISESNFLGTGDIVKTTISYGQYGRGIDLAFTDPWFLDQHVAAGVDLFGKQTFASPYQSYSSSLYGTRFSLGTPISENLTVGWNYSIYNQGLSLDPAIGIASLPIQQAAQQGYYWVSSIGNSVTYSTLDNNRNPTSGIRAQFNNDVAGLGGAAKFARNTNDIRYYHEIVGDVVGMVRAQSGYVTPWGGQQLPLLNGFFGGPQLVRGFAPNGFGPRNITPGTTMDNVGGSMYWASTAELQSAIPGIPQEYGLRASAFVDAGSVFRYSGPTTFPGAAQSLQVANSNVVRSSVGVGLSWASPFGALTVNYAVPLTKASYDVVQPFNFNVGPF